jgi:hypothetical protein
MNYFSAWGQPEAYIAGNLVLREKLVLCTEHKMPHTNVYLLVKNWFVE